MDVIGCGALNYDRLYRVKKLAKQGDHEPVLSAFEAPGGSAANTIAHLAAAGKKTGFIGALGRDIEAGLMRSDFKRRKVDVSRVKTVSGPSGVVVGFVDDAGERTLYPNPGANNRLVITEKDVDYASKAGILHLSSFVSEKQLRGQKKLVRGVKDTMVSFSPGHLYATMGVKKLAPVLSKTSFLFVNEAELSLLGGRNGGRAISRLHKAGAKIVVVTLGELGCMVSTGDSIATVPSGKSRVVDSTGAGDGFCAGFLSGVLEGKSLLESGANGIRLAKKVISRPGAR